MTYKVTQLSTGEFLGDVYANHSMTKGEVLSLLQIPVMRTEEDYAADSGYDYDDLGVVAE